MAIHITNAAQLQAINSDLSNDYILDNDIDLTGVAWTPIGGYGAGFSGIGAFCGTFDGQGHTIRNLTFNDTSYTTAALFGFVGKHDGKFGETSTVVGSIKNLNLENFVLSGNGDVAALFGLGAYVLIDNVNVSGVTITPFDNFTYEFGGLGGFMYGWDDATSIIKNCTVNNANISCGYEHSSAGGLIGALYRRDILSSSMQLINCAVDNITISCVDRGDSFGGIVGYSQGYIYKCKATNLLLDMTPISYYNGDAGGIVGNCYGLIANCYAQGEIRNCNYDGGGIAGFVDSDGDFLMKNCWANVNISGDGNDDFDMGGLVGFTRNGQEIRNCYSFGTVTGQNEVGGLIGGLYTSSTVENCAWWTGSCANAIGYNDDLHSAIPLLATTGLGTDEATKTNFYSTTHPVYAQSGTSAWGFSTTVWVSHVSDYPSLGAGNEAYETGQAPPVNDNFASRIVIPSGDFDLNGNNKHATIEVGEDATNYSSVWYEWTANKDGFLSIQINKFYSRLRVFTGNSVAALTEVASTSSFIDYILTFPIIQGTVYKIAICDFYNSTNVGRFQLTGTVNVSPSNDNFDNAINIPTDGFSFIADNRFATTQIGEPSSRYKSIWYTYSPTKDGSLVITTNFGRAAVYTGNKLTSLTLINDGDGSIVVPVRVYRDYRIVLYNTSDVGSLVNLSGSFTPITIAPNDNFSQRILLTGDTFSASANNFFGTTQIYEDDTNYRSLWYEWVATKTGELTIAKTDGIDIAIKVYLGNSMFSAVLLKSGNNTVSFPIKEGLSYKIAVCSQDSVTYGAFSFASTYSNLFNFAYTQMYPYFCYNGTNGVMRRSSGNRIYILRDGTNNAPNLERIYYTDDEGVTAYPLIGSEVVNKTGSAQMDIDSNGNLWIVEMYDSNPLDYPYFNFDTLKLYNYNVNTQVWTTYTKAVTGIYQPFVPLICVGADNVVHILYSIYDATGASSPYDVSRNLIHISFNGAFSTADHITNYTYSTTSGGFPKTYETVAPGNPGDGGVNMFLYQGSVRIIWSKNKIVWSDPFHPSTISSNTKKMQYNVLSSNIESGATIIRDCTLDNYRAYTTVCNGTDIYTILYNSSNWNRVMKNFVDHSLAEFIPNVNLIDIFSISLYSDGDIDVWGEGDINFNSGFISQVDGVWQDFRDLGGNLGGGLFPHLAGWPVVNNFPRDDTRFFFVGRNGGHGSGSASYLVRYDMPAPDTSIQDCGEVGQIFSDNLGPTSTVLNPPDAPIQDCAIATKIISSYT